MDQPERNPDTKGVNGLQWVRYVLGNYASVQEALDKLDTYQIYTPPVELNGKKGYIPVHFSIEDASGDSAVIEYVSGKLRVHRNVKVMTNEPSYNKQIKNLSAIKKTDLYTIDMIPGGAKSENRFVRASFIDENMAEAQKPIDAVNYMFAAADSVSVPFTKNYKDEDFSKESLQDIWPTQWKSVISMKNKRLYFSDTLIGNRIYIDLNEANLDKKQDIKTISAMDISLKGDVTKLLEKKAPLKS